MRRGANRVGEEGNGTEGDTNTDDVAEEAIGRRGKCKEKCDRHHHIAQPDSMDSSDMEAEQ